MSVRSPGEIPGEILEILELLINYPVKLLEVSGEYLIEFPRKTLVEFI